MDHRSDEDNSKERMPSNKKKQSKRRRQVTHDDLGKMWDDVLTNGVTLASSEFGLVGDHFEEINRVMNWTTSLDTVLAVYGEEVIHIRNNHGEPGFNKKGRPIGETRRGQLPIKKEDFANLPKIFEKPSFTTDTDFYWGEVLLVSAVIEGHLTAVVIHSSAKNMLRVLSMRKYP